MRLMRPLTFTFRGYETCQSPPHRLEKPIKLISSKMILNLLRYFCPIIQYLLRIVNLNFGATNRKNATNSQLFVYFLVYKVSWLVTVFVWIFAPNYITRTFLAPKFKLIHFSDYNLSFGTVCNLTSSLFFFRICLLPDERSERKCTQQGDSFAELNPNFSENVVFQVSMLLSHFLSSHVSNNQAAVKKRESGKMLKTITLITFDWQ